MNYARKEHPELIRQTVEEKPWFVKAMGAHRISGVVCLSLPGLLDLSTGTELILIMPNTFASVTRSADRINVTDASQ
jgi:hypothetical protein